MSRDLTTLRDWARRMAETQKPLRATFNSALPHRDLPRDAYPTDPERVLWQQIADEIDTFLAVDEPTEVDGQSELFGGAS